MREFLTNLAVEKKVAASTQNQAFSALLFLYREVLQQELPWIDNIERAKRPPKLPVVFTPEEARAVLGKMRGTARIMAQLLYGSGLRLTGRELVTRIAQPPVSRPGSILPRLTREDRFWLLVRFFPGYAPT